MYQVIIAYRHFGFTYSVQDRILFPTLEAYEVGLTAEEIGQLLGGS